MMQIGDVKKARKDASNGNSQDDARGLWTSAVATVELSVIKFR